MNSQVTVAWPPAQAQVAQQPAAPLGFVRRERRQAAGKRPWALIATIAVHALVLGWILLDPSSKTQPLPLDTVTVTMTETSKPTPEPTRDTEPETVTTPKAVVPLPELNLEPSNEPTTAIRQVTASAAPQAAPTESAPVVQPRFDADYLNNPAPVYPAQSRRMHERGEVRLRVLVSRDGLPMDIQLARSCGYTRLDQAALTAVRKWRFQPAQRGGVAVDAWVIVPIEFDVASRA